MEQSSSDLFSLNIDPVTKSNLSDIAKWARFLSIIGMIFLAIFAVAAIFGSTFTTRGFSPGGDYGEQVTGTLRVTIVVSSIIFIAIAFFPLMYLFQFSGRMKRALVANDQEYLNAAFLNLKKYFRYMGIMVIIVLTIYVLFFVIVLLGSASR